MRSDVVKQLAVVNQALGNANTVTKVTLPGSTYHLFLRGRIADGTAGAVLRIHPNQHQSDVFYTVPVDREFHVDRLHHGNEVDAAGNRKRVLWVSSPTANGVIAEALCYE